LDINTRSGIETFEPISRTGSTEKELVDLNVLCEEISGLAYHGARVAMPTLQCKLEKDFQSDLPSIKINRQDIGRVLLNIMSNGFYALNARKQKGNTLNYIRGDGNAYTDGTYNNNGADYAEFFESANGQALTLGATVVLVGNKIREATDQDDVKNIIGVVRPKEPSKASMVVGNTAWNKWANKYLTDDFDRYIMEDHDVVEWTDEEVKKHSYESQSIPSSVTVPNNATRKTHDENNIKFQHYKINPEWDSESEYVNRENRPEWNIIGLLGQVKMLKGKPVGDRWIKMRNVSNTVEEWFIR
jgi:hypothetical protein